MLLILGTTEGGVGIWDGGGEGRDDVAEGVAIGEVESDVRSDPVSSKTRLARLVRAGGVETELDPIDFALLFIFSRVGEGSAEHGGY